MTDRSTVGITDPPRRRLAASVEFVVGVALIAVAATASRWFDSAPLRDALLFDRSDECAMHHDGAPAFVFDVLSRERWRFLFNVQVGACLLGAGFVIAALVRCFKTFAAVIDVLPSGALAGPIAGALLVAAFELGGQAGLAVEGARDGLFTEDAEAKRLRFFDAAVAPAEIVNRIVPANSRIVVIDFRDSQVVKKFGYLVYPRRVFMPPRADFRFSANEVRDILRDMPRGIDWCFDAGYTHLVDLATLERDGDPAAIIDLRKLSKPNVPR